MRTLREPLFFANAPPASEGSRETDDAETAAAAASGSRRAGSDSSCSSGRAFGDPLVNAARDAPPGPPPLASSPGAISSASVAARMATRHPSACPANSTRSTPRNAQSSMTMRACSSTSYGESLSENSPRFGLALNPNPGRSRQITRTPSVVASEGAILRQQNAPAPKPCTKTTAASGGKNPPSPPSPTLSNESSALANESL